MIYQRETIRQAVARALLQAPGDTEAAIAAVPVVYSCEPGCQWCADMINALRALPAFTPDVEAAAAGQAAVEDANAQGRAEWQKRDRRFQGYIAGTGSHSHPTYRG